jgi:hypothetical protein
LQREIGLAEQKANPDNRAPCEVLSPRTPITTADFSRAVWDRYTSALEGHEATRDGYPNKAEIAAERTKLEQKATVGQIAPGDLAMLDASIDFLLVNGSREVDRFTR